MHDSFRPLPRALCSCRRGERGRAVGSATNLPCHFGRTPVVGWRRTGEPLTAVTTKIYCQARGRTEAKVIGCRRTKLGRRVVVSHEGVVCVASDSAEIVTARAGLGHRTSRAAVISSLLVISMLVVLNVTEHLFPVGLWLAPPAALAMIAFARWRGLNWTQLGLARDKMLVGGVWAAGAIAVVAVIYLAGVLLPLTRPAFLDARYHFGVSGALISALLVIPVGTILLEEVAFRSVLWGTLSRHMSAWRVLVTTSVLFGLWHILPSTHLASANRGVGEAMSAAAGSAGLLVVLGTVAFTALGGIVAGELRRRSGSLLASAGMHWATNGLGVLFGLAAWHIAR